MALGDQSKTPVVNSLDEPELPQRLASVKSPRQQLAGQLGQLGFAAGAGQRRLTHVVLELEMRIVDPHRQAHVEGGRCDQLAVARHVIQARAHAFGERLKVGWGTLEKQDAAGVHVQRTAVLEFEQASLDCRQTHEIVRIGAWNWCGHVRGPG